MNQELETIRHHLGRINGNSMYRSEQFDSLIDFISELDKRLQRIELHLMQRDLLLLTPQDKKQENALDQSK